MYGCDASFKALHPSFPPQDRMEKLIKKALYTGVGMVAATTECLQHVVDDLVERGKLSEEEGKKVVDDVIKNTETHRSQYESRFKRIVDSAYEKLNIPVPQSDTINKLEKRVKSLEVKLGLIAKELEKIKANQK